MAPPGLRALAGERAGEAAAPGLPRAGGRVEAVPSPDHARGSPVTSRTWSRSWRPGPTRPPSPASRGWTGTPSGGSVSGWSPTGWTRPPGRATYSNIGVDEVKRVVLGLGVLVAGGYPPAAESRRDPGEVPCRPDTPAAWRFEQPSDPRTNLRDFPHSAPPKLLARYVLGRPMSKILSTNGASGPSDRTSADDGHTIRRKVGLTSADVIREGVGSCYYTTAGWRWVRRGC